MKQGEQAIPAFFRTVIDESSRLIKKQPKKKDEDALVQLADSEGWEKVKEIIENKQQALDNAYNKSMRGSTNLEEIGMRALIKEMVTVAYQSVIDTVELPIKAREYEAITKSRK